MPQPANFSTLQVEGVDVTTYWVVSASLTPETPAPPFVVGQRVFANNGAEFVFVQASTTLDFGDFLAVKNSFLANGLTNTNVVSSLGCAIGIVGAVVAQSVTYIPAGAYFWAQMRGSSISGNARNICTTAPPVQLFTSATAGAVTSVTTSSTLAAGLAGIECISSTTPIWNFTWPRTVAVFSSAGGTLTQIAGA